MQVAEHVRFLDEAGRRLAVAAERAGFDAPVPTCPGWAVRDLLTHIGGVHRWAASFVTTGAREPVPTEQQEAFFAAPADEALLGWFRDGHRALVAALSHADPALECWSFLPARSPLAFWARRQAHETTIHRVDCESAAGEVTGCDPALAADGIDELICGFLARRRGRLVVDPPVTLAVCPTDTDASWAIRIEPDGRVPMPGQRDGDCVLSGSASDLYLFLWNRGDVEGLDVRGDRTVLELWRERARVRWS